MNKSLQNALVTISGLASSTIIAILLSWIELRWGHALYSYTVWFVIPIGAICVGMLAASGFLAMARVLNFRPTRTTLVVMLITSISMFFAIQWINYNWMTVEGKSISGAISFQDFLSFTISHTTMQVGVRGHYSDTGIELGASGYGFAAVQILGFVLGGGSVYLILAAMTYCEKCSKYFSAKGVQHRYHMNPEGLQDACTTVMSEMQAGRVQHAILLHASSGSENPKDAAFSSNMELKECKGCGRHWTKFQAKKKSGSDWNDISGLSLAVYCDEPVELHRILAAR